MRDNADNATLEIPGLPRARQPRVPRKQALAEAQAQRRRKLVQEGRKQINIFVRADVAAKLSALHAATKMTLAELVEMAVERLDVE